MAPYPDSLDAQTVRAFRAQTFADQAKRLRRRAQELLDQAREYEYLAMRNNPTNGDGKCW